MRVVVLGLSITSSWGNGHATTYRALLRGLAQRGHDILFLECDKPWYRDNCDLSGFPYATIELYRNREDLKRRFTAQVRGADAVIVGSYVPEGAAVCDWVLETARGVRAFYDIDTPVTLTRLAEGNLEYLAARQIPEFDLYLSFTGGPALARLERQYGARAARALYCSVDATLYHPISLPRELLLGYLGTYSADRQPALDRLLLEPARRMPDARFAVAGPLYPSELDWPGNVRRIEHLPPTEHRDFYNTQRFTLNVTRADMVRTGFSPSVRLFEAAACGTPVISDPWEGLDQFFTPGREILIAHTSDDVERILHEMSPSDAAEIGQRARARVMTRHTAEHRAFELEGMIMEAEDRRTAQALRTAPFASQSLEMQSQRGQR